MRLEIQRPLWISADCQVVFGFIRNEIYNERTYQKFLLVKHIQRLNTRGFWFPSLGKVLLYEGGPIIWAPGLPYILFPNSPCLIYFYQWFWWQPGKKCYQYIRNYLKSLTDISNSYRIWVFSITMTPELNVSIFII